MTNVRDLFMDIFLTRINPPLKKGNRGVEGGGKCVEKGKDKSAAYGFTLKTRLESRKCLFYERQTPFLKRRNNSG